MFIFTYRYKVFNYCIKLPFFLLSTDEHPQFEAITTVHVTESNTHFQNYKIVEVHEVAAPTMVSCHTVPYPYMVFYCHYQTTESKVFRVPLMGENGDKVEAVAVCHMDTSHWNSKHPAFRVLGMKPGESHVCHFFPDDNFVWVPRTSVVA